MVDYSISGKNLHLIDSYKESKNNFANDLELIETDYPDSEIWNRSIEQMCLEWATHNLLYALGILRSRTKDCDLNYPQKWYVRVAYAVLGCIAWLFIK